MFIRAKRGFALALFCTTSTACLIPSQSPSTAQPTPGHYKHVLILSVDGLHSADVTAPALQSYLPNVLKLRKSGITFTNAFTAKPSDSFPGTLSYITGATPKTTGVYYDDSYDRQLTAPGGTTASPRGTEVLLDETIDKNPTLLSGGGDYGVGSIDLSKLPQDCSSGTCKPVYPHNFVQTNTIFDVAKAAGLHTAFSDKHAGAYDILNGPNGNAIDDYYSPEIAAQVALDNGQLVDASNNPNNLPLAGVTSSVTTTEAYDDLKVKAILNEIKGLNSQGTSSPGVPAIFGMNFQAVSVSEKAQDGGIATDGTPSAKFADALKHTDASIGQILDALKQNNLLNSTLVILTAKHGQSPRLGSATLVKDSIIPDALEAAGIAVAQTTGDDVALLWLKNQSQARQANLVLTALKASNPNVGIADILFGNGLVQAGFGNPLEDNRTPDIIVKLKPGFVLVGNLASKVKRAEHGGFSKDDTNVALIVSSGRLPTQQQGLIRANKVETTQIAVTALEALGLNPDALQGAKLDNCSTRTNSGGCGRKPGLL